MSALFYLTFACAFFGACALVLTVALLPEPRRRRDEDEV